MPVRIRIAGSEGTPRPDTRSELYTGGAHDCSIASQIKALTGEAPTSLGEAAEATLRADGEDEDADPGEPDAPQGAEEPGAREGAPDQEAAPEPAEPESAATP